MDIIKSYLLKSKLYKRLTLGDYIGKCGSRREIDTEESMTKNFCLI